MFANKIHEEAEKELKKGNIEKAIKLYTKALKDNPDHPDLISDRGVAYLNLNDEDKCMNDLNRAVKLQPKYAFRYACRAFALSHFKKIDAAVADYEMAVKLDPDDSVAHNNLGLLLEQKGYQDQANEKFARADKLSKQEDQLLDVIEDLEEDSIEKEEKPAEEKKAIDPSFKREKNKSSYKEFKKIFTTKSQLKEFLDFVKNGFKIK